MLTQRSPFLAAAAQHPPVFLDLGLSVDKACSLMASAAEMGVQLLVFPETWLPGYPVWVDEAPGAALWDHEPAKVIFTKLFENSVAIPGEAVDQLCQAARSAGIMLVMGLHERDGGTLYNATLTISAEGEILGKRRKLLPTYGERLLWGQGDGSTLSVMDSALGRVGGLICWEHWMPLARYAMHAQHELVHTAQWPWVKELHLVASRSYAFEGQCFVIAAGTVMRRQDLEHLDLAMLAELRGETGPFLMRGGSAIIAPSGEFLAGPVYEESGLITAEIDPQLAIQGRMLLDVSGHYARPDVFQLHVNTDPLSNVSWG